jgi:hypothetical protein
MTILEKGQPVPASGSSDIVEPTDTSIDIAIEDETPVDDKKSGSPYLVNYPREEDNP